jgi:hypothetical protein
MKFTDEQRENHLLLLKTLLFNEPAVVYKTSGFYEYVEKSAQKHYNSPRNTRDLDMCREHSLTGTVVEFGVHRLIKGEDHDLEWTGYSDKTVYDTDLGEFKIDAKYHRAKHQFGVSASSIPHLREKSGIIDYLVQGDYVEYEDRYVVTPIRAVELGFFLRSEDFTVGSENKQTKYKILQCEKYHTQLLSMKSIYVENTAYLEKKID